MPSLTFVFKALATSLSGHVEPRQGLALGWLGSVVAGLAVVFGTADRTPADPCFGIAEGSSGSHTTPYPCEWQYHKPAEYWQDYYLHYSETPADSSRQDHYLHHRGNPGCVYLGSTCGSSAATAIEAEAATTPSAFVLGANYPNPFNPATTIPLVLPAGAEEVALTIYNVLGQPVRRVWAGSLAAGEHRLAWDGRDAQGQPVSAGVYWYRLQVGDQTRTRKMVKIE